MFENKSIAEAFEIAIAADKAYSDACIAGGYKSRWDVPAYYLVHGKIADARRAKIAADDNLHKAFEAQRAKDRSNA